MKRGKKDAGGSSAPPLFNNPFGALKAQLQDLPAGPELPSSPKANAVEDVPARAVVRMERKGRGGKEITAVEQLDLPPDALARWLKELKQQLGCGGAVEGTILVLQGDQRERLPSLLRDRGVKKVIVG